MDRHREASRRGNPSGGAQISTLRRPRTSGGFKDPADEDEVMEDLHSARLRERPRKDSNTHSVARHKRTRNASRELYSRAEDIEETEAGEVGPSDDDDVPISPNLLPRKPTKLRFHGKVASNEVLAVEIPAVPRKARTAISKRPHEGSHGDGSRHQGFSSAPLSSTAVAPFHTPLAPSLKPMKRMKHTSPKFKASKHVKVSAPVTISQQEVEVAEALFDLARMVSNLGSPGGNDEKLEVKTENSELKGTARLSSPEGTPLRRQDSVSTPQTSHSAASSPVRGPIPVTSSHLSSTDGPTKKISFLKLRVEDGAISQPKDEITGRGSDFKSVVDSCTGQSVGSNIPADVKVNASVKTGQGSHQKAALSSSLLPLPSQSSVVADSNVLVTEAKSSSSPKIPVDNVIGSEHHLKSDASLLTEFSEQKQQHGIGHSPQDACDRSAMVKDNTLKTTHACKYEIDLMASPNASASGASEKTGNSVDSGLVASKRKQDQVKTQTFMDMVSVKEEKTLIGNDKEARMRIMPKEEHVKAEMLKESEGEKQYVEAPKQEASDSHQSSKLPQHPASGSGPGWPGSLPHMGYYPAAAAAAAAAAAVAAAWPATGSVMGPVSMEEKGHPGLLVPPFTFPGARPLCKRCAMHVYIAHFIDTQQQMQRHPIWAAAYGNNASGSLYSMKSYNANAPPLPPNVLFGGGLTGLTGLTVNNSPSSKVLNSQSSPQNDKGSVPAVKEMCTYRTVDGSVGNGVSQSSQPDIKDQTTPFQAGLGSTLGYSPAAHSNVSLETGGNNVLSKVVLGGGSTTIIGSCPELAGASTGATSNTHPASTAAAQVQYLQAIIQQAGFPFSFSPGHLMQPTQGHLTHQQTPPFFNNPFYNPPFMHSQQSPTTGKVTPKSSSLQGQSTSMHRDIHASPSVSQQQQQQQQQQHQHQHQHQHPHHHHQQQQQQQFSSASSSHSHQRAASQHLQHFGDVEMNLGAETVSSAESKFPSYQNNMHGQEISNMHGSNNASSSSLNSAGMSVLPAQVALATRQMTNMKLPQSGQAQQQSPNTTYHYPSGSKSIAFQSAQASSGMHMGGLSKNMVGPGPLGLASVAAVMAPQGHAVLQTMSDTQLSHAQAYQESYSKHISSMNLDGARASSGLSMAEDKRLAVKQGGPAKMDKESEGSSGYKSGLSSSTISGTSFNFMNAPVGSSGSRQAAPVSVGSVPSLGMGRVNPNTAPEPTASSRTPSPSLLFHVPNVTPNQGLRQGQVGSQYSSQAKPVSRMQGGTTGVPTAPSALLPSSYAGVSAAKQQSYPSKNHQVSMSSMQSRFPSTTPGSSGASVSPSTSVSKANGSAAVKSIPGAKGSLNSSQKPNSATPAKKSDAFLTHLPGQVMGPSSITVNMGQSQPQQHQSQHPQMQHVMRQQQQQQQQQQQWQQQQKQVQQEHSQQAPQSIHQQYHVTGVPPAVTLQYHQALGTNQVHKQSASSQPAKQLPYLEQHPYQPQQQQSQVSQSQQSARMSMQPQLQHAAQQTVVSVTNRSALQLPEIQANKHLAASGHHQPMSLASFGALPSTAQTPASFSIGSGSGGRPGSSEGNLNQVSSPKGSNSMKPPGGISVSVSAPNVQRSCTSSTGISQFQGVGAKGTDVKLSPQSSGNIGYFPYLQSATFSGGVGTGGKVLGASGVHAQTGASMISMRDGCAGPGHENSASHDNERSNPASKASVTSGYSVCATAPVKYPASQPTASCTAPLPLTPGQSSQTCTVTSATMTADSVSTTV